MENLKNEKIIFSNATVFAFTYYTAIMFVVENRLAKTAKING